MAKQQRFFNALVFGQRADGRIRYDLPQQLEARGYKRLELSDVEFFAICGHHVEILKAIRRSIRSLDSTILGAIDAGDNDAATAFRILKKWARRTHRHLRGLLVR